MRKFIYTSLGDFHKPKKEMIYTSYSDTRYTDTITKLNIANELALEMMYTSRTMKSFKFWETQYYTTKDLITKQKRLRHYDAKKFKKNLEQFKNFI